MGRPGGREHPSYTEQSLTRAIAMGIDPAGAQLRPTMPHYHLTRADMQDLISYLKKIATALDPGLTPETIRIGCVLSASGENANAEAVKSVLDAFFDRVNRAGGVYNRTIEAVFLEQSDGALRTPETLDGANIFAVIGSFSRDKGNDLSRLFSLAGVPAIAAGPLFPQLDPEANKSVFYLDAGVAGQIALLAHFAHRNLGAEGANSALVYPDQPDWREAAAAVIKFAGESELTFDEFPVDISNFDIDELSRRLNAHREGLLYLMLPGAASQVILSNRRALAAHQVFLIPGSLITPEILDLSPELTRGVYFGFPTLPSDESREATVEHSALADVHRLSAAQRLAQRVALSSARVMMEVLEQAGRELSREKLIARLENIYEFQTGFTPPLTFGPNRRAGSLMGHVLTLDNNTRELIEVGRY